jgi:hypothetical protein
MSVLIAVPACERGDLLKHCLATLAEMSRPAGGEVMVFDDASRSLDVETLMQDAGLPILCYRSPRRLGASAMVCRIWEHFLRGHHEHLLFVDSDMIANTSALIDGLKYRESFDGLITLYNSWLHAGQRDGPDRLIKRRIGNAGTFWTRALCEFVHSQLREASLDHIDDTYSQLLAAQQIPILSVQRSRLQHLGILGSNNRFFGELEHGLFFQPDSVRQMEAIVAIYDNLMCRQKLFVRPNASP